MEVKRLKGEVAKYEQERIAYKGEVSRGEEMDDEQLDMDNLTTLDEMKISLTEEEKRDVLVKIAKTSLNTKLHPKMASQLTDICVDAMLSIDQAGIKRLDFIRIKMLSNLSQFKYDFQKN